MTWRDELRPASWRGLACHVGGAEATGGRRLVVHEYPLRDEPYPEDMGRRARAWSVDAFLLGPDVLSQARAFADALEAAGAGTWVDPWRGEIEAVVETWSWRQSSAEGGIARFQIQFREAGEAAYPELAPDHAEAAAAATDGAWERTKDRFGEGFSVSGLADALKEDISGVIGLSVADIAAEAGAVAAAADEAAGWARAAASLAADARLLIEQPGLLADRFMALIGAERLGGLGWRGWLNIASWAPPLLGIGGADPEAGRANANRAAYAAMVRAAGAAGAARAAAAEEFATYDEAIEARTAVVAALDEAQAGATHEQYRDLERVRATLVSAIAAQAPALPRLMTIDRAQPVPALVLAWELYGARPAGVPARADEIVARNEVRHPLFCASPLEVLSDG